MALQQMPELNAALQAGADRHASDIYLMPHEPLILRIDGELIRTETPPFVPAALAAIAAAAVGEPAVEALGKESARAITACSLPGIADGRLCVARTLGQLALTIRLFPRRLFSPEQINLPPAVLEAMAAAHGLVIFTGVCGSGKTTTAFTCLEHINATRGVHILTLEDPVNCVLDPKRAVVTQHEIGTDAPDMAAGLAAALEQDPDVIFVAEVRSLVELRACLTAAQSGHLVIVQLHVGTAPEAVQRMLDVFPDSERGLVCQALARELRLVCAQRLLRCATGKGRVPAYSVLVPDARFRDALAKNAPPASWPMPATFRDLAAAIKGLRDAGTVSEQEAARVLESGS